MELYNAFALLLLVAAGFGYLNHRFLHLPSAIGLMVLALVLSLGLVALGRMGVTPVLAVVALVARLDFDTLLMQVLLSFLLFAGAIHVDTRRLERLRWPVGVLATAGTLLSTVVVATAMYVGLPLLGLPTDFIHCLLFGALISPTDPIAVLGILTKANIPKEMETKIVGESLFNDGVGVVVFVSVFEVAALGYDAVQPLQIIWLFVREAVGGLVLGAALGYGTAWLLRTIDHYQTEVLLTLALVAGGTALAAWLHTSGPLAMVMAGLLVGHYSRAGNVSDRTREYLDKFWELLDEVLNAVLFVLIGLEMLVLHITRHFVLAGVLAVAVVLVARLVSVSIPLGLLRLGTRTFAPYSTTVLTWGGLRGGISVALALSLPATMPRDLLVGITYVVVVFSIIGQGLTIGPLVRRLGLSTDPEASPPPQ